MLYSKKYLKSFFVFKIFILKKRDDENGRKNQNWWFLGYGNLGKGVELAIRQNPDMELAAFFTRRAPEALKTQSPDVPVYNVKDAISKKDDIDVMILCGGSATDLPVQSPEYAKYFNIVDSFDTHAKIPEHFANVDASRKGRRSCCFSFPLAGTPVCSACRD